MVLYSYSVSLAHPLSGPGAVPGVTVLVLAVKRWLVPWCGFGKQPGEWCELDWHSVTNKNTACSSSCTVMSGNENTSAISRTDVIISWPGKESSTGVKQ